MHGPRDRRLWAASKDIHVVWDCWFMHDRKKRERQECGHVLKITNGSLEREEQDTYSSSLSFPVTSSIPSPTSSTWPDRKDEWPRLLHLSGGGILYSFSYLSSQGHSLGSKSKAAFELSSLLTGCLWQGNSASGPLFKGELQPWDCFVMADAGTQ